MEALWLSELILRSLITPLITVWLQVILDCDDDNDLHYGLAFINTVPMPLLIYLPPTHTHT